MTDLKNTGAPTAASLDETLPTGTGQSVNGPAQTVNGPAQAVNGSPTEAKPGKQPKPRSTPLRKVLKVLIGLVSLLLIFGVAAVGYAWFRVEQIPKVAIPKDPGVPPGGALPTIAIPLSGNTVDGGPVITEPSSAVDTIAVSGGSSSPAPNVSADPTDSVPGEGEGSLTGPIATVAPVNGTLGFGPLLDTSGVAALGGPNAKNYLMIGVDSRSDIPTDQEASFGKVGGSRSDTIMLLRLDPSTKQAWVLSFPRDLYVRLAGTNQFNRLNAAYARSAGTLVSTLRENFNVPVDHFAIIDFVGFQRVVEALGGVTIDFPKAARDLKSGLNQPAGRNLLDPKQATAYVRSRYLQEEVGGVWTKDPRGDLGRIQRQQAFIRATLSQAVKKGFSDPLTANALLTSLKDALTLDSAFGIGEIASLTNDLRSFDPNTLQTFTVPGDNRRINGKDVLIVNKTKARAVIGQFGQRKTAKK